MGDRVKCQSVFLIREASIGFMLLSFVLLNDTLIKNQTPKHHPVLLE